MLVSDNSLVDDWHTQTSLALFVGSEMALPDVNANYDNSLLGLGLTSLGEVTRVIARRLALPWHSYPIPISISHTIAVGLAIELASRGLAIL